MSCIEPGSIRLNLADQLSGNIKNLQRSSWFYPADEYPPMGRIGGHKATSGTVSCGMAVESN